MARSSGESCRSGFGVDYGKQPTARWGLRHDRQGASVGAGTPADPNWSATPAIALAPRPDLGARNRPWLRRASRPGRQVDRAVAPPSTTSVAPVTKRASSEARKRTAL